MIWALYFCHIRFTTPSLVIFSSAIVPRPRVPPTFRPLSSLAFSEWPQFSLFESGEALSHATYRTITALLGFLGITTQAIIFASSLFLFVYT